MESSSTTIDNTPRADPEVVLLQKFQAENQTLSKKWIREADELIKRAGEAGKTDPNRAIKLLELYLASLDLEKNLDSSTRKQIIFSLQGEIKKIDYLHMQLPEPVKSDVAIFKEYLEREAREAGRSFALNLPRVNATIRFYNGCQRDVVLHRVNNTLVTFSLNGQQHRYLSLQVPVIQIEQGIYLFDYQFRVYQFLTNEQFAALYLRQQYPQPNYGSYPDSRSLAERFSGTLEKAYQFYSNNKKEINQLIIAGGSHWLGRRLEKEGSPLAPVFYEFRNNALEKLIEGRFKNVPPALRRLAVGYCQ